MRSALGEMKRTYNAKGWPTGYTVDVYHMGLARRQTIRGANEHIVRQTALAKADLWNKQWDAKRAQEEAREERARLQSRTDASLRSAQERTSEAQNALSALDRILGQALELDARVDWESLKSFAPYSEPRPLAPTPPVGKEPLITDTAYQPKLGFADRVLQSRKSKKKADARALYETRHASWQADQDGYAVQLEQYAFRCREWEAAEARYMEERAARNADIDRQHAAYLSGDPEVVRDYCDLVLSRSQYPDAFPATYAMEYGQDNHVLIVDYQLPSVDNLPTVREVAYVKSREQYVERRISDSQAQRNYDSVLYQIALRTIHEILDADVPKHIASVVFNGYVECKDAATGQDITPCVLSVQANRDEFEKINLANVDPKTCFRSLKGVAAARLHSLTPIAPVLRMQRSDARFVSGYAVAEFIQEGDNLASMDWLDFEHLIRELFEEEYGLNGAEVRITRASRDGGVDAIAFDPDPLHGGKTVIQAKRYTGLVGVSAVRDLYGTVLNEGANRGILVTTSTFGPDSYEFAKGKPLVLIDGGNLLHLLGKHGHKARIDLQEARRLAAEQ